MLHSIFDEHFITKILSQQKQHEHNNLCPEKNHIYHTCGNAQILHCLTKDNLIVEREIKWFTKKKTTLMREGNGYGASHSGSHSY